MQFNSSISLTIFTIFMILSCQNSLTDKTEYDKQIDSLQNEITQLHYEIRSLEIKAPDINENFDGFLSEFMGDSVFQISRIKFPIQYIHWKNNIPGSEVDTSILEQSDWTHDWLYLYGYSSVPQVYDNFEMKFQPTNYRLLQFKGVETGTNSKYFFEAIDYKWYLKRLENLGD